MMHFNMIITIFLFYLALPAFMRNMLSLMTNLKFCMIAVYYNISCIVSFLFFWGSTVRTDARLISYT